MALSDFRAFKAIFKRKDRLNVIIGFDTANCRVKIMEVADGALPKCKVGYYSADRDLFIRGKWAEILNRTLPVYSADSKREKAVGVHVVLPDCAIGRDEIVVPTLSRLKTEAALDCRMRELYTFYDDYKFKKRLVSSNRTNSVFGITMTEKQLLNGVYKALNANKMFVKNATYASAAALSCVFTLFPKTRKGNFLFLDIKDKSSLITICSDGAAVGVKDIPFGTNVLSGIKIVSDYRAEDGDCIADFCRTDKESVAQEPFSADSGEKFKEKQPKSSVKRAKKFLPATYRSEFCVPEDYMAENFRLFLKEALLVRQSVRQKPYCAPPEYVLVNLPEEYAFLTDEINDEQGGDMPFRLLQPPKGYYHVLREADLYGAVKGGAFSKTYNL